MNLIVFDIDGTLLNSTGVDDECYQKSLKESFGISIEGFDWEMFTDVTDLGVTQDILKKELGREATAAELLQVELKMGENVWEESGLNPSKFIPAPGIESLLKELDNQNEIGYCFATGAWMESALAKLSNLNHDISNVPWDNSSFHRRRADIVKSAMERAKAKYGVSKFENVCALGDGEWDLLTAKELNLNFIGIDLNSTGRIAELGATHVIKEYGTLEELSNLAFT